MLTYRRVCLAVFALAAVLVGQARADFISSSLGNWGPNNNFGSQLHNGGNNPFNGSGRNWSSGSSPSNWSGQGPGLANCEQTACYPHLPVPCGNSCSCTPPTPSVPEPASMLVALFGGLGMTAVVCRYSRRRAVNLISQPN